MFVSRRQFLKVTAGTVAAVALAVAASLLAGVFPALRASGVAPAMQLKTL